MSDFGRRFDASELGDGDVQGDAAAAELLAIARDLEAYARTDSVALSADFEDRVMTAIAGEPPPVRVRGLLGIVTLVRDSWRLAWSSDRPVAVRAQALAFVLLAAVALGSLGSLATVGVGALLSPDGPTPTVEPAPLPTPSPSPVPRPSPSSSPTPSATPTQETAEPTETAEATETPESTDDSSGSGSGSGSGSDSSGPGSGEDATVRPTDDSSGPGSGGDSSGPDSGSDSSGSGSGG
jgi:hypothetical protein